MRVLLDARTVGRDFSGVGNYVLELVRGFAALDEDVRFDLCVRGGSAICDLRLDERFTTFETRISHESHPLGDLWEELVLPRRAAGLGADVLHGPAFVIPCRPMRIARVVTIHDLVAFTHPHTIPRKYALYMRWQIRRAVRHATRVITVSRSVADDLARVLGVRREGVEPVLHGVSPRFRPPDPAVVEDVRRRHGLPNPYVLFVGNLEPRKNVPGLVRAFRSIRERFGRPLDLVVVGRKAWLSDKLVRELGADPTRDAVRVLGYVPAEDLPALYGAAEVFAFPSFHEGFGLPVLEAMACGTPVVTSGTSSLPEVAGDAAVLVDPGSPSSIAEGLLEVLLRADRRAELVQRGLRRVAQLDWLRTARETLRVYREARAAAP
ncbi:MAG: glycosyltransferase family 4 protein [bacterium]